MSSYRPQTQGQCEKFNGTLVQGIYMYCSKNQEDWDSYIPAVLMGYRTSTHESTKVTPFELVNGRECCLPIDTVLLDEDTGGEKPLPKYVEDLKTKLGVIHKIASENIIKSQVTMKKNYDRKTKENTLAVGDIVYIYIHLK